MTVRKLVTLLDPPGDFIPVIQFNSGAPVQLDVSQTFVPPPPVLGPLARAWSQRAIAQTIIGGTTVISALATITPLLTGKLRVVITGVMENDGEVGADTTASIQVSHGASATPVDYFQPDLAVIAGLPAGVSFAMTVDLDQPAAGSLVFPVGAPVQINAVIANTGANQLIVQPHGLQLSVQELAP